LSANLQARKQTKNMQQQQQQKDLSGFKYKKEE
jgi:hypothetical protein